SGISSRARRLADYLISVKQASSRRRSPLSRPTLPFRSSARSDSPISTPGPRSRHNLRRFTMPELSSLVRVIERTRAIATLAERGQLLASLCNDAQERATVVDFFNQHAGNLTVSNAQFRADFLAADCVLRDGIGARLAFKLFGRDGGLNMNGTDLI